MKRSDAREVIALLYFILAANVTLEWVQWFAVLSGLLAMISSQAWCWHERKSR